MESRTNNRESSYIFISYSHKDSFTVNNIRKHIVEDGYQCWYDEHITPASEWDKVIATQIKNASLLIAFISRNYLQSNNCMDELRYARDKVEDILFCYLEDVQLPDELEFRFGRLQNIRYYAYSNKKEFFAKLYKTMYFQRHRASLENTSEGYTQYKSSEGKAIRPIVFGSLIGVLVAAVVAIYGSIYENTEAVPEDKYELKIEATNENAIKSTGEISTESATIMEVEMQTEAKEKKGEYIIEDSNSRYLTDEDVKDLTPEEIYLAKNEIYARHGRKFQTYDLNEYFSDKSWYKGTIESGDFNDSVFSDIEIENLRLLFKYETKYEQR